jgi:hypothetical protein
MRPLTYILILLLGAAGAGHFAGGYARREAGRREALQAIKEYVGKELRKLEPAQVKQLVGHLSNLGLAQGYRDWVPSYGPWYIWDFSKKGEQSRYLLFEADTFLMHPGRTQINLTVLEDAGKVVSETYLSTGWRCYLQNATLERAIEGEYPLIVLNTGLGPGPGPDVGKQYYAWMGARFDLVRLEDSEGKATRNRYYVKHFRSGSAVTARAESEWVADLASADRVRVLRALVWLGGTHWDLQHDGTDASQLEEPDQVHLVLRARANPTVIALLRGMVNSDDRWVSQAAWLAANPEDDHF